MKIAMIDPSSFTPPYNNCLCNALGENENDVSLYTKSTKLIDDYDNENYLIVEKFYRISESTIAKKVMGKGTKYLKGFEHIFNMLCLFWTLKKDKPDIIHFQWCPMPSIDILFVKLFRMIAPVVLTVHDTNVFHGNPSSKLQMIGWIQLLRTLDHLIVHTDSSKKELSKAGISEDKISKVEHGLFSKYQTNKTIKSNNKNSSKKILFFGNIKEYKGVDVLIDAYALLDDNVKSEVKLVLAGKSYLKEGSLQKQISRLGIKDSVTLKIEFIPDDEIWSLFSNATVVVFPYRDIDASGALMLALPFKIPVIASDIGVFSEILTDGVNSLLVEPNSAKQLSLALAKILSDKEVEKSLKAGTSKLVSDIPSWGIIANKTRGVYKLLLKGN